MKVTKTINLGNARQSEILLTLHRVRPFYRVRPATIFNLPYGALYVFLMLQNLWLTVRM